MSDEDATQRVPAPDAGQPWKGLAAQQRVFGRYTLGSIAGRGGMGVVWRAHDDDLERVVALKFLPDVVASDAEAVRDLKRETKRCLDLTHPNIVRVYDFMQDPASAAIAMEFVEGVSLAKRKAESPHGCLEVSEVAQIAGQLCAALDYAHFKAHIIHRDLKPANLLVTHEGDLKVMDFGIARSLTETRTRLTGNAAGGTSGTLLYMSPQQLMGEKPCIADDMYALGATLFELLAGKPPFYRGDGYGLMTQIREKAPPSMTNQREDLQIAAAEPIPVAWEDAIAACLAKDPEARPRSADDLAHRLGVAIAAVPTTGKSSRPGAIPPPPPQSHEEKSGPRKIGPWLIAGIAIAAIAGGSIFFFRRTSPAIERPSNVSAAPSLPLRSAPALPPPVTDARGGIIIRTEPSGAEVTVSALDHGPGPLTIKEVKTGNYPVRVRAPGYEEWTGVVNVKENDFAEVTVPLVRSTGYLLVTSEPAGMEAEVTGHVSAEGPPPDGRQVIKTPQRLKVGTGEYKIVFRREGWPEQNKTIEVARGQNAEANAAFVTGKLIVTSEPSGAEVISGGKVLGLTPLTIPDLQPGTQSVELRLKGHKGVTLSGVITPRGERRLYAELETMRGPDVGHALKIENLGLELMPVAAGSFTMGSPVTERKREKTEGPQTHVTISTPFWMGKTEVTQKQYESLMGVNPSKFKRAGENAPVENVMWTDAVEFCRKLTERERAEGRLPEGYAYMLPTEAQWEYACRAGTTSAYAGDVNEMAWHEDNRDASGKTTHPVAQKKPNAWGLYDMHGNVAEWCLDNYAEKLPGGSVTDYVGPPTGSRKVFRGGSWDHSPEECRSAIRIRASSNSREDWLGFRVALVAAAGAAN